MLGHDRQHGPNSRARTDPRPSQPSVAAGLYPLALVSGRTRDRVTQNRNIQEVDKARAHQGLRKLCVAEDEEISDRGFLDAPCLLRNLSFHDRRVTPAGSVRVFENTYFIR